MAEGAATVPALARDAVLALSERLDEPAWLREGRLAAWEALGRLAPPSPSDEGWRRTDPAVLSLDGLQPGGPEPSGPPPAALTDLVGRWVSPAAVLVHRAGRPVHTAVDPALAARGVVVSDLVAAARQHPELVRRWWMTEAIGLQDGYLAALHAALGTGGAVVVVPDGVEVADPVVVVTWVEGDRLVLAPHLLVVAGRASRLTVVATTGSDAGEWKALLLPAAEVVVGEGAQVRLVTLQRGGGHVCEVGILRAVLGKPPCTPCKRWWAGG
jgi:Fe-S cluster assembly protein SufD